MAAIPVGEAISEGFQIIRRAPGAVLLWGSTQFVYIALVILILGPFYVSFFHAVQASGTGGGDPTAAMQAFSGQAQSMQGFTYLIDFVQIGMYAIVYCAVFRAVLHPERGQWGYMRLSMPELFVGGLLFGAGFAFGFGFVFAGIVVAIVIGILVALHVIWAAVLIGLAAALAAVGALLYFGLRLSLVGPMIVDTGEFRFAEAWRLTKGQVGALFLVGLALFAIALFAEILLGIVIAALGLGLLAGFAGGLAHVPALFQQPLPSVLARLGPLFVLFIAIWIPFAGCLHAVMAAPWARVYRSLKPPDVAAAFA